MPTINPLGGLGATPVRNDHLSNWYGAVGVTWRFQSSTVSAIQRKPREAELRAQATLPQAAELRNRISRDVRTAWLNAKTAYDRVSVARQLLDQSNQQLDLANTRYYLGLGSIFELSQPGAIAANTGGNQQRTGQLRLPPRISRAFAPRQLGYSKNFRPSVVTGRDILSRARQGSLIVPSRISSLPLPHVYDPTTSRAPQADQRNWKHHSRDRSAGQL